MEAQKRKQLFAGGSGLPDRKGDIEAGLQRMNRSSLEAKKRKNLRVRKAYIRP